MKHTQAELNKAFEEGKQAALAGSKRTLANPYTNWELYTAFNNGWKEGLTLASNERLIVALKRAFSVAKNESTLDFEEIQLIEQHIEKLEHGE
jgi:ribosome modulation factor